MGVLIVLVVEVGRGVAGFSIHDDRIEEGFDRSIDMCTLHWVGRMGQS